jgi:polysaccharide pyruvyl transferase WcaK-like protein
VAIDRHQHDPNHPPRLQDELLAVVVLRDRFRDKDPSSIVGDRSEHARAVALRNIYLGREMIEARRKIGIFGNFGGGNLGNEGTLEAMVAFLRRVAPDAELVCICADPRVIAQQHQISAAPFRWPRQQCGSFAARIRARLGDFTLTMNAVRGFDLLIVPGTGILDDFGEPPQGLPLTIFWVCLLARMRRMKICMVSIGAGPIRHRLSRWLMKRAAVMAHYRSYRDRVSKDFMRSLGLHVTHDEIYPDLAFNLPEPSGQPTEAAKEPTIGVGVMAYGGWGVGRGQARQIYETYIQKMTSFVLWLLECGYRVRLLIGEDSDNRAVADLTRCIAASNSFLQGRVHAEPASSLHDLMQQMLETEVVVATRFHNVVCALKVCRPTVSLGYSKKNDALLAEMGLQQFCQDVETFDLDLLIRQVSQLLAERSRYVDLIRKGNLSLRERLRRQDEILKARFIAAGAPRS